MSERGLPVEEFEWPCDRRDAHGSHLVEIHLQSPGGNTFDGQLRCPGVGAHPLTMIGGAYKPS